MYEYFSFQLVELLTSIWRCFSFTINKCHLELFGMIWRCTFRLIIQIIRSDDKNDKRHNLCEKLGFISQFHSIQYEFHLEKMRFCLLSRWKLLFTNFLSRPVFFSSILFFVFGNNLCENMNTKTNNYPTSKWIRIDRRETKTNTNCHDSRINFCFVPFFSFSFGLQTSICLNQNEWEN